MLVNCPKCGFSQPKDRYCANCGVDMELYKPVRAPFWKKVLGSPLLHVSIIFMVVLISVLFIRERQQVELRARVEYLKGGPVLVERQQASKVEVSANSQATAEIARENSRPKEPTSVAAAAPVTEAAAPSPAPAETAKTTWAQTKPNAETSARWPGKAVVIYAEVDRSLWTAWLEEMRSSGQLRNFDDVTMGVLPQMANHLRNNRGVKILQQLDQVIPTGNPAVDWFVGTHRSTDPENEMGFFSSLTLTDAKEGLTHGELEVQRAFRDPKDPNKALERVSFGGPFEMTADAGYVMRGLLPRKFVTDLSQDHNSDPFLSIFNSRSFVNGQTEFTMILQFDTGASQGK